MGQSGWAAGDCAALHGLTPQRHKDTKNSQGSLPLCLRVFLVFQLILAHGQRLAESSDRASASRGRVGRCHSPARTHRSGESAESLVDLFALAGGTEILYRRAATHKQLEFVSAVGTDVLENGHETCDLLKVIC